jgi:hypothetical protein
MTKEQADVAQLVEQLIRNQQVNGSSPFVGSIIPQFVTVCSMPGGGLCCDMARRGVGSTRKRLELFSWVCESSVQRQMQIPGSASLRAGSAGMTNRERRQLIAGSGNAGSAVNLKKEPR